MRPRHYLLLLALLLAATVTGCRSARPESATAGPVPALRDTATALVVPPRRLVDKLLGLPAAPAYRVPAMRPTRIGKKATIYYGPATITTVGKKATAATAPGATAQVATNAVAGNNNTATQTAAPAPKTGWLASPGTLARGLARALPWLLLALLALAVRYRKHLPFIGPFFS